MPVISGGGGGSAGAVSSVFSRTGAVVAANADYSGIVAAALTGAVAATRYVGGTASVAPTSGTFAVGDFVISQTGHVFACTVAGTPGTWVDAGSVGNLITSVFGRTGAVAATAGDYTGVAVGGTADALAALALTNAMVSATAGIAVSKLADPTTGKVVGSVASAAAAVFPPGYEIGYTEITSSVNVASTTEASGTTIISPGALVFDGAPVLCHFFTPGLAWDTATQGDLLIVSLFEGGTQISRIALANTSITSVQAYLTVSGFLRFTPSAASHTYTITAFSTSGTGTPKVLAAAKGTGIYCPAFVRFTKV